MAIVHAKLLPVNTDTLRVRLAIAGGPVSALPKVLNKYHLKGHMPPGSKYIGRGSPYGNPFVIGVHGDRETIIKRFCEEILPDLDVTPLRGCDLICFCKPKPCHGDPILIKANK